MKITVFLTGYYPVLQVAYITAAKYILSKFPNDNELLISLSAIDSITFSIGQSITQRLLTKLEFFFPTIVTVEEKQSYLEGVNRIGFLWIRHSRKLLLVIAVSD